MNSPENPIERVIRTLNDGENQRLLSVSLPKVAGISIDKFNAAVIHALRTSPQVFVECDRQSLYNAIFDAARRGLVPDGKQGALVPFNTRTKSGGWVKLCQFMIMPEGIIDTLARSGISIYAESVYELDEFRFWSDDDGQHVDHKFNPFGNRGARIGAYACAKSKDGTTYVEAMGMEDIKKVMAASKQKDQQGNMTGPWKIWRDRMEQKSCMHRVCKRTPNISIGDDDEYTLSSVETDDLATEPVASAEPGASGSPESDRGQSEGNDAGNGGPVRPRALQRIIDEETGQVLGTDVVPPQEEQIPVEAYNEERSPF